MRELLLIFTIVISNVLAGQVTFRTIAPRGPVIAGEAFRIQYVIEDAQSVGRFSPPAFHGFRVVNDPDVHSSHTGLEKPIKNMIFTLQAHKPGRYYLQGARAVINGKELYSNDVVIEVVPALNSRKLLLQDFDFDESPTYLKPGEDPYRKINENLFMRVLLDKQSCYPGEPVVATFKLYSRLLSRSDIIKNPGFYGFAVHDMIGLDDHVVNTEVVNGKSFDVHTVRKVQLYPLQPGKYIIDAMEVKNRVEFSRSVVNRKGEQEIIEGIFEDDDPEPAPDSEVFETQISTKPLAVTVRPLPANNKPGGFNDATGKFRIEATLVKSKLSKNEEGQLSVIVRGEGNFTQLVAPVIQWPAGIEGFEPSVEDELDKMQVPLKGSRTFSYAFVASQPGQYVLPSIEFSFFDPDSNRYRRIESKSMSFEVDNNEKQQDIVEVNKPQVIDINKRASLIAAILIVAAVLTGIVLWLMRNRKPKVKEDLVQKAPEIISTEALLRPAYLMLPSADKDFYSILHHTIRSFLGDRFRLEGSAMSKQGIRNAMQKEGFDQAMIDDVNVLLHTCEAGMFTDADLGENKEALLLKTRSLIDRLNA